MNAFIDEYRARLGQEELLTSWKRDLCRAFAVLRACRLPASPTCGQQGRSEKQVQLIAKLMRRPGVRKEVERIEQEEGALLDILLKARQEAGMFQAQVAERMGMHAPPR